MKEKVSYRVENIMRKRESVTSIFFFSIVFKKAIFTGSLRLGLRGKELTLRLSQFWGKQVNIMR